jgi:single-strand DNA-binding protein
MAWSLNRVQLIGNVGKDPEIRTTQSGTKIVNLSVATSESWTDKQSGERKERTEWHRVVIFNDRLADVAEQYIRKGSKVFLEGALQTRKWTDQSGQDRYSTEIVLQAFNGQLGLLGDRSQGGEGQQGGGQQHQANGGGQPRANAGGTADSRYAGSRAGNYTTQAPSGGPSWERGGGDLDDEIPFSPCWQ